MKTLSKTEYNVSFLLIVGWGIVTLFSASSYFGSFFYDDDLFFLKRQLLWTVLAFVFYTGLNFTPLKKVRSYSSGILLITIFLNFLTYIPGISYTAGGASRWLSFLGFTFQPSEVAKLSIVLYVAHILEARSQDERNMWQKIRTPLLLILGLVFLIYGQNDFSTTFFLIIVLFFLLFLSRVSWRILLGLIGSFFVLAVIMVSSMPYRMVRMKDFLESLGNPTNISFQLQGAYQALASGKWWGRGLGQGIVKKGGLPVAQSDFIVAVFGEEMGLVGILCFIGLNVYFCARILQKAESLRFVYARFLAWSLVLLYSLQIIFNLAVVTGLFPTTGIPLPLFSAGGTSLIVYWVVFGLLSRVLFHSDDLASPPSQLFLSQKTDINTVTFLDSFNEDELGTKKENLTDA